MYPGRLAHVEAVTGNTEFARDLDMLSGIDAWHIMDGRGIRGIASRVQHCPPHWSPYNTFTIRRSRSTGVKTEYEKRKEQISSGGELIYPHLTIHAYIDKAGWKLRSVGVALTRDIIKKIASWIDSGKPDGYGVYVKTTGEGDATFYVVEWTNDIIKFRYEE
jgi:hypothetical protein